MSWGLLFDATSFIQQLPSSFFLPTSSVNYEPSDDSLATVCGALDFQIRCKDTTLKVRSTNF